MRITVKIATAGVSGLSRFPVANYTIDECTAPDGRLDPAKTRRALDVEQVQIGSKDDLRVLAFALEYLTQQRSVVINYYLQSLNDATHKAVSLLRPIITSKYSLPMAKSFIHRNHYKQLVAEEQRRQERFKREKLQLKGIAV